MEELLQSESVDWCINSGLADKKVVVNDWNMVLGELHIKLNIRGSKVGGCNERLNRVFTQL